MKTNNQKIENVVNPKLEAQIQNSLNLTEKLKVPISTLNKKEVETGNKLKEISLAEITNKLKDLNISEKYKKTKSFIYLFQLNEKLTDVEQKKKRNTIRRNLERLSQNCLLEFKRFYELKNVKTKDVLNESIKAYVTFIRDNYIVSDVLSQTNFLSLEEKKQINIFALIEFIKFEIQSKNQFIASLIENKKTKTK